MLDSEGIAGKRFLKFESVVELLKEEKEKGNLFADFPIGATIQDSSKRKRSNESHASSLSKRKRKEKKKKINIKSEK